MMKILFKLIIVLTLLLNALTVYCHNLAPGLLRITLQDNSQATVSWKVANMKTPGIDVMPIFPDNCTKHPDEHIAVQGLAVIYQWQIHCTQPLIGQEIRFSDLSRARTNVMIVFTDTHGKQNSQLINAESSGFTVPASLSAVDTARQYVASGIEHLIFGWDHVLFVSGLVFLLLTTLRKLVWAISSFTVGHSASLLLASFGLLPFNAQIIEVLIAITLIILALEILKENNRQGYFSIRQKPYAITFLFGLIHGCGFASVLAEALSAESNLLLPLLSFNLGIEAGQLLIILFFMLLIKFLMRLGISIQSHNKVFGYFIGALSSYWLLTRLLQ